jgi:hypothetical protein
LEEIFPRKGQDIWFFGQSNKIWYESNYIVLVRKKFFPKKLLTGERLSENFFSGKIFEIGAPEKNFAPGPRQAFGGPGQRL